MIMEGKVLLIDDDPLQHRLTQEHFRRFQSTRFTLECASEFDDGLRRLLSGDYAACLLDYQLGERDGISLIHEAMEAGCRTPIVILTAETADRVDIEAMNAGALDYLVKGEITPRMLERSLRYALKLGDTLDELRRLATRDQLTGLLNRREFDRILREEFDRANRFSRPLSLVMIDLDHFKRINDTHGHQSGDAVLQEAAARLESQLRSVDRLTRFGGEEFAAIMMEMTDQQSLEVARRMGEAIRSQSFPVGSGKEIQVTVSLGIAGLPGDAGSVAELVAAADKALYAAKKAGRDRAQLYTALNG